MVERGEWTDTWINVCKKTSMAEYWFKMVEETHPCVSAKDDGGILHMDVQVEEIHIT